MRKVILSASAVALLLVARSAAQEPAKPGPEHEKMKALVGTWDANVNFMGKESKGTMTYVMGLGDLWLFEHFKGEVGGMTFEGKGASSYDAQKKKFINIWIDSMSTWPMISEGNYDKDNRLVMKGQMTGKDGKMVTTTNVSEMKGKDEMIFTMTGPGPDGKEGEMMKITYTRRAKGR